MSKDAGTRTLHRSSVSVEPLPVLLGYGDASRPSVFRLSEGSCTVGGGSRCDVVLADPTVSRTHAELTLAPEGVIVRDLGSRNGTFYMGQRITSAVLSPGTRISLGGAPLTIDLDAEHLAEASPLSATQF